MFFCFFFSGQFQGKWETAASVSRSSFTTLPSSAAAQALSQSLSRLPFFYRGNIAPTMRKSGPPPPGQRSIASFFGARPAVAAAGAAGAAAAETKVCFRLGVFDGCISRESSALVPSSLALSRSLSCPLVPMPCRSTTRARMCSSRDATKNAAEKPLNSPMRRRRRGTRARNSNASPLSISLCSHSSPYSRTGRRRAPEGFGDGDRRPSQGRVGCRGRDNDNDDDDGLCRRGDPPSLCGRSTSCCFRCCCSAASFPERGARRASGAQKGQQGVGDGGLSSSCCCEGLRRLRR